MKQKETSMTTRKMKLVATTAALSLGATAHAGTAALTLTHL